MPTGPLEGYRIIEVAGIGPGPFAGMMLADMGADVIRVDRSDRVRPELLDRPYRDVLQRGRRSIGIDLKSPAGVELFLRLTDRADGLFEPYRPGVVERLGIGPDVCLARNPRLVYGRMTGWGQSGPYADTAGHDINYIALAGALWHFGRAGERPTPPINLVGDFGGGGMLLAFGMVCGLLRAQRDGQGQVIDAAMVDGSAALMTMFHAYLATGQWEEVRGGNVLDTGAPFYDVYECADGEYISVGSVEPQFYRVLLDRIGLGDADLPGQLDRDGWPKVKERFTERFLTKTREEWCQVLEGTDACFAPVLRMSEAVTHPHNVARRTFVELDGVTQPAPAPRFSATPGQIQGPPVRPGHDTDEVLADWLGADEDEVARLRSSGGVA